MRMGIDLGGTKMECVAMDKMGEIRRRIRVSTPSEYPQIIEGLAKLKTRLESEAGPIDVAGVGTPGCICPHSGRIKNAYNTALAEYKVNQSTFNAKRSALRDMLNSAKLANGRVSVHVVDMLEQAVDRRA